MQKPSIIDCEIVDYWFERLEELQKFIDDNKKTPSQIFWLFDAFNQSENIFDAYSLTFKVTFDPKARVFGLYGKNWSIFGHFWAQNKILGHFSKFWQIFDQIWSILPDFCPNSNFHWNFKEAPCTWYVHFFWSNAK